MSEEAAVFAGRNEFDDPFPIVPDDEPAATPSERDDAEPHAGATPSAHLHPNSGASAEDIGDADARATDFITTDPITNAVLAGNSQLFLQAVIGIAAANAQHGSASDTASLGVTLAGLGKALAEASDEEQTFQDLVDTFERRRLEEAALHSVAPLVAIFVSRLVSAPYRHEATSDLVENLMHRAEEVVGASLQAAGARAWRRLPQIAMTMAERAAHRGLSFPDLIDALPRLAKRFGLGPRGPVMHVVSHSDHPRAEVPRGDAMGEPRRMLISGPVEIVILNR
jgi:hypothetical protein